MKETCGIYTNIHGVHSNIRKTAESHDDRHTFLARICLAYAQNPQLNVDHLDATQPLIKIQYKHDEQIVNQRTRVHLSSQSVRQALHYTHNKHKSLIFRFRYECYAMMAIVVHPHGWPHDHTPRQSRLHVFSGSRCVFEMCMLVLWFGKVVGWWSPHVRIQLCTGTQDIRPPPKPLCRLSPQNCYINIWTYRGLHANTVFMRKLVRQTAAECNSGTLLRVSFCLRSYSV